MQRRKTLTVGGYVGRRGFNPKSTATAVRYVRILALLATIKASALTAHDASEGMQ